MFMNKQGAKIRIEKLKSEINKYRYAYHVLNKSLISDEALDSLKKELFDLEQRFPDLITLDSPTQRVGGKPLDEFKKVRHEQPMLSFNDAFSENDMRAWFERLENYLGRTIKPEFYCELKIDGLAIELVYKNGVLVQGSTRGDGAVGEDITHNVKTIEAIPLSLMPNTKYILPKHLIIRGEVFLTKKEFDRLNKKLEKEGKAAYANPRNLAAGSMRQLDPRITAHRRLDSFQYDIASADANTHEHIHETIKKWGFKINPHNKRCDSLEEVFKFRNYWGQHRERLPYEIDGVVIIVNNARDFEAGGIVGKTPRAAIAYKFSPKEATTIVEDIIVQVGRTGVLTPVAVVQSVDLSGVTVTRATLHNYDEIKRLGLQIGDTVVVSRAGDVIPQITKVLAEMRAGTEKEFVMPKHCPVDGAPVIKENVLYRCSNKHCGAVQRRSLQHFVSRAAFNIEGLGKKIIDRFIDENLISDAADIFTLQKKDIAVLERFGEKSAENIVSEVNTKKIITLPRFIYALGILHVGEGTARALAQWLISLSGHRKSPGLTMSQIVKIFQQTSIEDLQNIPDIGPIVAHSIYEWFRSPRHQELLEKFARAGIRIEAPQPHTVNAAPLIGKIFVITGALQSMSRDEAKEKIRALGGEVSESVSKKTSFVIMGENPGSKAEKAKELAVQALTENQLLTLLQGEL